MYHLLGSLVLGWSLGSNDAANVFGTAVASRMVRYRTAVILAAIFIMLGAMVQGAGGIHTLGGLTSQTAKSAMIVALMAGVTVLMMTSLKLPVSSSQAVVGAIIGAGLSVAPQAVRWSGLIKVASCWVGNPIGSAIIAAILYPSLGYIFDRMKINLVSRSILLKSLLLITGCYGAYAMGANSAGNVVGVFQGTGILAGFPSAHAETILALIGGASIALGVLTYSRNVMFTVGSKLVQLGAFSAWIAILSMALTVHIYSFIGVPVSTSQATVGAVLGIGLVKGAKTISHKTLIRIMLGWISTPAIAAGGCYAVTSLLM